MRQPIHARALLALGLTASLAVSFGCSGDGPREIVRTRIAAKSDPPVIPGVTLEQRYRWRPSEAPAAQGARAEAPQAAPAFAYTLPSGWEEVPPTQFRHINTRVRSAPNAECYLTFLPGDGGGDLPNVNRWRGEMGQPPIDAAGVAALPRTTLLGAPAIRTDLTGSFTGMSGQKIVEARMLGVLLTKQGMPGALFVKFIGPANVIGDQTDEFDAFVASIDFSETAPPPAAGAGAFTWQVPAGWTAETAPRAMREVTLRKGESELYVSVLGGGGGGLLANINRWMKQFGAADLDVARVSALERTPCLGGQAYVVTAEGSFAGMDGAAREGMGLVGALLEQPARLVTVKLVGPAAEVRAERAAFLAFVGSLSERP